MSQNKQVRPVLLIIAVYWLHSVWNYCEEVCNQRNVQIENQRFQQDGATAHTAHASSQWIVKDSERGLAVARNLLSGRRTPLISAYVPSYFGPPQGQCVQCIGTNQEMFKKWKTLIMVQHSKQINQHHVIIDFKRRFQVYLERNAGHIEHVIWTVYDFLLIYWLSFIIVPFYVPCSYCEIILPMSIPMFGNCMSMSCCVFCFDKDNHNSWFSANAGMSQKVE